MRVLYHSPGERDRRMYASTEAAKLGRGGVACLARVLGCDEKTIRRGRRDPARGAEVPTGRSRKKGAVGPRG